MKAARRQELRTNDLSQQLDRLGETFKRNSTTLSAIILGAAVIVAGGYWYTNHRATTVNDALAKLSFDTTSDDTVSFIDRCKSVANAQISPEVTRAAWFSIGAAALGDLMSPPPEDSTKPRLSQSDLQQAARDAFTRLLSIADGDPIGRGAAMFGLGLLDENAGKYQEARDRYTAVLSDKKLEGTPFIAQAEYRLAHLGEWSKPVTFPEPAPLPPMPEPTADSQTTPTTFEPSTAPIEITPIEMEPVAVPNEGAPPATESPASEDSPAEDAPSSEEPVNESPDQPPPADNGTPDGSAR